MHALQSFADAHGLHVVEDAAHAFGSTCGGRALGTFGTAGCFSFDPIKAITCGEGGAIATHSPAMADRLRAARCLGITADGWSRHAGDAAWRYDVQGQGWRCHMPNLNAAIGLAQLPRLDAFRARRQAIVRCYESALGPIPGLTPLTRPRPDVCPFTYVVRVHAGRRDALMTYLRAAGIGTSVEYIPNHLHQAFAAYRVTLPATEEAFGEILSLPLHAGLTDEDVTVVVRAVQRFFQDGGES
jgi:dTDP-4-amino-4,6-dideoxygalactose transaminase